MDTTDNQAVIRVSADMYDVMMQWQEALMELDELDLVRVQLSEWYIA